MKRLLLSSLFLLALTSVSAQIDTTIGLSAPKKYTKNTKKLAHYLCDNQETDREKVVAIYNWMTHNIEYDVKQVVKLDLKHVSTKKVLKQKKAVCEGYAKLFVDLCKEVEIPAMVVDGYSRDWMCDDGDAFYIPRHAWNAVYVGLQWELIDVTWGAGAVGQEPSGLGKLAHKASKEVNYGGKIKFHFRYDPAFCFQDPLAFRIRHLPSDPVWQLTDSTMPLTIFEAGEDAVTAFNKEQYALHQSDMSLNEIGRMDEMEKMIAVSERAYSYNPRFKVVMAEMHIAKAMDTIVDLHKSREEFNKQAIMDLVKTEMKSSEEYVKDQKKNITAQYSVLERKNKAKHADAKRYITLIRNDNKKLSKQCASSIRKADNHILKEEKQTRELAAKFAARRKVAPVKNTGSGIDAADPRLVVLADTIQSQMQQIQALKEENKGNLAAIETSRKAQQVLFDSMVNNIVFADSALVQETMARINLYDNLDKQVKKWNVMVKDARLARVDSLQKYYLSGFDSVVASYEAYSKTQKKELELCNKAMKCLEQYKRKNSNNADMLAVEEKLKEVVAESAQEYQENAENETAYYKDHKRFMNNLVKLFQHEDKLADYMEKAENHRNDEEAKTITQWQGFDKKENEHQVTILKTTEKKAERYLSRR